MIHIRCDRYLDCGGLYTPRLRIRKELPREGRRHSAEGELELWCGVTTARIETYHRGDLFVNFRRGVVRATPWQAGWNHARSTVMGSDTLAFRTNQEQKVSSPPR